MSMNIMAMQHNECEYIKSLFPNLNVADFLGILKLLEKVNSIATHNGNISSPTQSVFDIIKQVQKYKTLRCVEYSNLITQIMIAYNVPSRVVNLKKMTVEIDDTSAGHVVMEFWSDEYNKWIILDPQYSAYFTYNEIPLSCFEIQKIGISNVNCIIVGGLAQQKINKSEYKEWFGEYLYFIDTIVAPDQNMTEHERITARRYMIVPDNCLPPQVFQKRFPLTIEVLDPDVFYERPSFVN